MEHGHYGILKTRKKRIAGNHFLNKPTSLLIKQQTNGLNPIYAQGSSKMMSHT
jgi:hypothetical protein